MKCKQCNTNIEDMEHICKTCEQQPLNNITNEQFIDKQQNNQSVTSYNQSTNYMNYNNQYNNTQKGTPYGIHNTNISIFCGFSSLAVLLFILMIGFADSSSPNSPGANIYSISRLMICLCSLECTLGIFGLIFGLKNDKGKTDNFGRSLGIIPSLIALAPMLYLFIIAILNYYILVSSK